MRFVAVGVLASISPQLHSQEFIIADFEAGVLAPFTTQGAGASNPVVTIGTTYQAENSLFAGNQLELDTTGAFNGAIRLNFGTGENAFARDSETAAAFRDNDVLIYDYFQPFEEFHAFRVNHLTLRTDVPGYPGFTSSMPGSNITLAMGNEIDGLAAMAGTYEYNYGNVTIPGLVDPAPSDATIKTLFEEFINGAGTFIQFQIVQQSNNIPGDPVTTAYDNFRLAVAPEGVPGDYNDDGVVDAADYVVWRDSLGAATSLPNEEPNTTPGEVTTEDYDVWMANFGLPANGSAAISSIAAAVPEPATWLLSLFAAGLVMWHARKS